MTIRHHPSLTLRSDFAASNLAPGAALAVATHLKLCPVCSIAVETMSGASAQAGADEQQFGRAFATQIDPPRAEHGPFDSIEAARAGLWWPLGPGARIAALKGVNGLGEALFLLKAHPGARLRFDPGLENLLVLEGALESDGQRYGVGDFLELDGKSVEQARADARSGVRCLLVADESWPKPWLLRFVLARARLGRPQDRPAR